MATVMLNGGLPRKTGQVLTPQVSTEPVAAPQPQPTPAPSTPAQPYTGVGLTGPLNPNYNLSNPANLLPVQATQATAKPASYAAPPPDQGVAALIASYVKANALQANQADPKALNSIVAYLRSQGVNAQTDYTDQNGHTGGILLNGNPYQLIDGSNNWTTLQPWQASGGGAGVFSDPATAGWEQALRALTDKLNQPQRTPDYSAVTDYMRQYMQSLQQPGYSPAQLDTLQTQALDPLTQQRDAQQQQLVERFAKQGLSPSSGIVQKAMQDLNTQFQQIRTQTQGQFATNVIGNDAARAREAGQVGLGLQNLEQATAQNDETRATQAVNLLFQIPQLADQRLAAANQTLGQPTNPAALLTNAAQFGQLGQDAQNQLAKWITGIVSGLFTS